MRLHLLTVACLFALSSCGSAAPPAPQRPALAAILRETKFTPHGDYTGADTPEDREPLQDAVDSAIRDIGRLPEPLTENAVRSRLSMLLDHTDLYATEDRDEVGRYAVRIWRAAGFKSESRLFPVGDERALAQP
ncbi:hypothetical protein HMF7854_12610 [Sphingomonas ginkgonis]|uniref:Uncharacterized protein n=1 Tax=Sphingomonas ginkgonis TaxID=2315330 RepID=A0A3R9WTP1_9SPHN|nr:hypothetical protein [Sphingomonas ginkgonis]RST31582.1 hypothetical protein HMF7854_12610 [Sphingomonas ginkgonis]